jgi:hypothetical protein
MSENPNMTGPIPPVPGAPQPQAATGPIPPVAPAPYPPYQQQQANSGPIPPAGGYAPQPGMQPYPPQKPQGGSPFAGIDKSWTNLVRIAGLAVFGVAALFGLIDFVVGLVSYDYDSTGLNFWNHFYGLLSTWAQGFMWMMIGFALGNIGDKLNKKDE